MSPKRPVQSAASVDSIAVEQHLFDPEAADESWVRSSPEPAASARKARSIGKLALPSREEVPSGESPAAQGGKESSVYFVDGSPMTALQHVRVSTGLSGLEGIRQIGLGADAEFLFDFVGRAPVNIGATANLFSVKKVQQALFRHGIVMTGAADPKAWSALLPALDAITTRLESWPHEDEETIDWLRMRLDDVELGLEVRNPSTPQGKSRILEEGPLDAFKTVDGALWISCPGLVEYLGLKMDARALHRRLVRVGFRPEALSHKRAGFARFAVADKMPDLNPAAGDRVIG